MAKKIIGFIKLQVPAGKANPSPPIGPALGQRGLNIMEFCKAFNAQTQGVEPGLPIPVVITAFADKSFTFVMKTPPATILIKKAAGIQKGSAKPHSDKVGKITRKQAEEIATQKKPDLTGSVHVDRNLLIDLLSKNKDSALISLRISAWNKQNNTTGEGFLGLAVSEPLPPKQEAGKNPWEA